MDKKGVVKLGVVGILMTFAMLLFFLALSPEFSAAIIQDSSYQLGEKVKLDLRGIENYNLKINTPTTTYNLDGSDEVFTFKPDESGEYHLILTYNNKRESFEFEVIEKTVAQNQETTFGDQIEEIIESPSQLINETRDNITKTANKTDEEDNRVEIDRPVKWVIEESTIPHQKVKIKVPSVSTNLSLEVTESEETLYSNPKFDRKSILDSVQEIFTNQDLEETITIDNPGEKIRLEYYTPGPKAYEKSIDNKTKKIDVFSDIHYQNVLAHTKIAETDHMEDISIFWENNNTYLNFSGFDTNNNSQIDYLEWIVPHLSNQSFTIEIVENKNNITREVRGTEILNNQHFFLGEKIKIDMTNLGNYELRIFSPTKNYSRLGSNDFFILALETLGNYTLELIRGGGTVKSTLTVSNLTTEIIEDVEIGKEVKRSKTILTNTIEIPKATNITLKTIDSEGLNYTITETDDTLIINITRETIEPTIIEYYTQAPTISEKTINNRKKQVTISAPDNLGYENVLSYTDIEEITSDKSKIRVHWKEEGKNLAFEALDTNNNSLIDRIKWITPHLSDQTFEIIVIVDAEHLDVNRNFIRNIYENVSELDNKWSPTISDGEYVRVVFEKNLTSEKDITIYPRTISGSPIVKVYEENKSVLITEFQFILNNQYNRRLLTNLIGEQNTFDLKILNGSLEFDHIIDPTLTVLDSDSFEDDDLISDNSQAWESYTTGGTLDTHNERASNGSFSMRLGNAANTLQTAVLNVSTVGYTSINVTFYIAETGGWEAGDFYSFSWFNGTAWIQEEQIFNDFGATFIYKNFSLGSDANNNPDFKINFTHDNPSNGGSEELWIDFVRVVGLANDPPIHDTPILNSSDGTNSTEANLTFYNQSLSDPDGDNITSIISWYRNNTPIMLVNMPFDHDDSNGTNSTKDYSGSNYPGQLGAGTEADAAEPTWNASGVHGGAYTFDGGDYIAIHDFYYPANSDPTEVTVAAWIITNSTDGIIASYDRNEYWRLEVGGSATNGRLGFQIFTTAGQLDWSSNEDISDGIWHHVVATYDNGNATMYIDGVVDSSTSHGTNLNGDIDRYGCIAGNSESTTFNSDCVGNHFTGTIDDFRIYNRSLSAQQINALYNNRTDIIVANETRINEVWHACLTPNDGNNDGNTTCSNNLTILEAGSPPTLTITYPTATNYSTNQTVLNYTILASSGGSIDSCWYSLDSGATNTSITCGTNATGLISRHVSNLWTIYGNSTEGDVGSDTVNFTVDTELPNATLLTPDNDTYTTDSSHNLTVNISDNLGLENATLFVVNSSNDIINQTTVEVSGTEAVIGIIYDFALNGIYYWFFQIFDSVGNVSTTENRTIEIAPVGNLTVTLIDPNANTSYNPSEFFTFTAQINCIDGYCGNVNATLDPAGDWWNISYANRRQLNITNASATIEQNYSMLLDLNTSTGEGFQADGNDLRIIYYNGTGNVELDRYNETGFNSESTLIWFRIQEEIASGNSDANYYIYYNNNSAIDTAPRNGSNVFEFFDDFNRADSGTVGNGWTESSGTWAISSERVRSTSNSDSDLTRSTTFNNHSIRAIANHEASDADWKVNGRASAGYTYGYQNGAMQLSSGGHTSANLGSSSYSPSTGEDYEIEMHIYGTRILAYADDVLIFNTTDTTHADGTVLLHAWDLTQFDDVWVRKFIEGEPSFGLGEEEEASKGIISTVAGTTPFYTTTDNPNDYTNTSCLSDMRAGDSCNVTWAVNATGSVNSIWEFFVIANSTNHTIEEESSRINITIRNLPPTIPELDLPVNNSAFSSFTEFNWSNSTDPTRDPITYLLEISNQTDFSSFSYRNETIVETEEPTGDTPSGITVDGVYYWRVLATDGKANSSYSEIRTFAYDTTAPSINLVFPANNTVNTSANVLDFTYNVSDVANVTSCSLIIDGSINNTDTSITKDTDQPFQTTLQNGAYTWSVNCTDQLGNQGASDTYNLNVTVGNNAPIAHEIECEESGTFQNCSDIGFGETLTRVRVLCSDIENGVVNSTFNLTNLPDSNTFFYNTTNTSSGQYMIFNNTDLVINDSGNFTITASCVDDGNLESSNSTTWLVPWGNLTIDLIDPSANANVLQNAFFTFTAQINCVGGECSNVNATLDPTVEWWNSSFIHRKNINISNVDAVAIEQNYSMEIQVNTTTAEGFQSDGDDLRIVYWNGSDNTELDVYNETDFNSQSTTLWFRIQEDIASSSSDAGYYMYYNYSGADAAPRNGSNVFEFFDDFNRADSGTVGNGWTEESGTWAITSNRLRQSSGGHSDVSRTFTSTNHSIRFIANHEDSDADWKAVGRAATGSSAYSFGYQNSENQMSSGAHNGENLCGTSFTASTGQDYEVELHMHGTRLLGYVDNTLYCNTTDSTHTSGETWIHAWDISQYDDFWIRKFIEGEPSFSLGGQENESVKGIVSTVAGTTPFYTTTDNPNDYTNTSCLGEMKGNSCNVTWNVNATGEPLSTWEFFVTANGTNYTTLNNFNGISSKINLTIVTFIAPTVPELNAPSNGSSFASLVNLNWTNSTDANGDQVSYYLQVDNNTDFSSPEYENTSISEQPTPTGDTPSGITVEGTYYWRVLATDGSLNSSWSDVWQFNLDSSPPNLTFINQSGEDGDIVNDSHPLDTGENITFFVEVDDVEVDSVWIVIWENVKGGAELVRKSFTIVAGVLWQVTIQSDEAWGLIKNYTIFVNDTLNQNTSYDGNITLLNGTITLNLDPNPVTSVTNVTASGHLNLSNHSYLPNHPINIWLNGTLLLLSNVTAQGTYDHHQEFNETSSTEFNKGVFSDTVTDGQNITIATGNASGNFTKIIDAGARVEWNNLIWNSIGASCGPTTVTFQEGDSDNYAKTEDSYISASSPTSNFGTSSSITVDGSPVERGAIQFGGIVGRGFNQIPENATITNANITFTVSDTGNIVTVYEILENWTESQVTYNNRQTSTAWSSTGIAGSPSRAATAEDTFTASSTGEYTIDISNSVNRWTNKTSENYGVVLDMGTSNGISIRSSEYSTQSERPIMAVEYTASECTNIVVYTRTSNDKSSWTSWQQVHSGEAITDSNIASRYLEYRVELTATNTTLTPILQELVINYTATVTDSSGDYSYNITNPSAFGSYPVTVNTSLRTIDITASETLDVQTGVAPEVSLVYPTDNIWISTANVTLIYNATDENDNLANATLIINNGINSTNTTPVYNGLYSNFTLNFTNGQYNWSVNVTDGTNLVANSSTRTFYIDLVDPNIELIYPSNSTNFTVDLLNISFNATDNLDASLLCNVTLNGSVIHENTAVSNGLLTNLSTGNLGEGIHLWNVSCVDNAGRLFDSETRSFNISDTPPEISLVWPETNYIDSDGNISFIFNSSDNIGFTNASLMINNLFDTVNHTVINNGINTTINRTGLSQGTYNWTILVYDTGGTSAQASIRNFSVDLFPASIELNAPSNSSNSTSADVSFNFTATDAIDTSLLCNLTVGDTTDNNFAAANGTLVNRNINNLVDGIHLWNVTCIDDAGHQNTSQTYSLNVSEIPNVILNTSNATSFMTSSINLSYIPSDNTNLSSCALLINSEINQTNSTPITNGQQNNFSVLNLNDGSYLWAVNCTDYANLNYQTEQRTFFIDGGAPSITLHNPDGEEVGTQNISFNFTSIDAIDTSFLCNLTVDTTVQDSDFSVVNGSVTQRNISGITDGFHNWSVSCIDGAGNVGTSSIFNFTKSTPPAITLTYPDDDHWFNSNIFNLTYFPIDDEGLIEAALFINGEINQTNSTPGNNEANNISNTGFLDGIYNWTVRVTDVRGLNATGTPNRTFYVDTQAPNLTLNAPNGITNLTTNNVTFNFTVIDNLDSSIECKLYLDGESEYDNNSTSGSDVINHILVGDGDHFWNVSCIDEATNQNISQLINFNVEAPPNVTLVEPNVTTTSNLTSTLLVYLPEDPIGINNCSLYIDDVINTTSSSINANQNNNFTILNIPEGFHNWTVGCTDAAPDFNLFTPSVRNFTIDRTPPAITLNNPLNNTNTLRTTTFNFSVIDHLDLNQSLSCNLYIDGDANATNLNVSNSSSITHTATNLALGGHIWNVSCIDDALNTNWSQNFDFNVTLSDLKINTTDITFNITTPTENETVMINATVHNLANVTTYNITVQFYDGDPDDSGTQIGSNQTLSSIGPLSSQVVNITWNADLGTSQIFVLIDPPIASNGSIEEWNESNNEANKSISVGAWHFVVGDITPQSRFELANNETNSSSVVTWNATNFEDGNIYVADSESQISWTSLQALGKSTTDTDTSNDFSDLDSLLSMTGFADSVSELYLNDSGAILNTSTYIIFNSLIDEIPIANSTNNTNFFTGILWDTADDSTGEYNTGEAEDIVFIAALNKDQQGAYGTYDYEIRIPATLRQYIDSGDRTTVFYTEVR